jgi:Ca2+-binding RTX toxin-like protein
MFLGSSQGYVCPAPRAAGQFSGPLVYYNNHCFFPMQDASWQRYPGFVDVALQTMRGDDVIRLNTPFDDIDLISGNDQVVSAGGGDDIVFGQRGNDTMYVAMAKCCAVLHCSLSDQNAHSNGGGGDDELFGMLGNDVISGGDGHDFIFGDLAHVVRATDEEGMQLAAFPPRRATDACKMTRMLLSCAAGKPRVNQKTNTWHRDIVLEELVRVTGHEVLCRQINSSTLTGARLSRFSETNYAVLLGKVNAKGDRVWPTRLRVPFQVDSSMHI